MPSTRRPASRWRPPIRCRRRRTRPRLAPSRPPLCERCLLARVVRDVDVPSDVAHRTLPRAVRARLVLPAIGLAMIARRRAQRLASSAQPLPWTTARRARVRARCAPPAALRRSARSACAVAARSSSSARMRSISRCSSMIRVTPARLMPSSCVSCWMRRSRSMSASEYRRVLPAERCGLDERLALVDAQRLRVHAGQLGGHADHVERPVSAASLHRCLPHSRPLPVLLQMCARTSSSRDDSKRFEQLASARR